MDAKLASDSQDAISDEWEASVEASVPVELGELLAELGLTS